MRLWHNTHSLMRPPVVFVSSMITLFLPSSLSSGRNLLKATSATDNNSVKWLGPCTSSGATGEQNFIWLPNNNMFLTNFLQIFYFFHTTFWPNLKSLFEFFTAQTSKKLIIFWNFQFKNWNEFLEQNEVKLGSTV